MAGENILFNQQATDPARLLGESGIEATIVSDIDNYGGTNIGRDDLNIAMANDNSVNAQRPIINIKLKNFLLYLKNKLQTYFPLKSNNGSDYTAATFRNNLSIYSKSEVNALIPDANTTTKGITRYATGAEVAARSLVSAAVTPGYLPLSTETQVGFTELANDTEIDNGTSGNLAVTAAQLKRKLDDTKNEIGIKLAWYGVFVYSTNLVSKFVGDMNLSFGTDHGTGYWTFNLGETFASTSDYIVYVNATNSGGQTKISSIDYLLDSFSISTGDDASANDTNLRITIYRVIQ